MKNNINYKKYHRDTDYNKFDSTFKNIFQKRFNLIERYCFSLTKLRRGKVLDIGCSNGVFLDLYKEKKWETWGVEPSKNAKKATIKKHEVINSTFQKAKLPQNYFDLIILNHTLEHLKNPEEVLKKVYKILKKRGIVFIDVPNVGSLLSKIMGKKWPYLLPNEHLWQFDRSSLTKLVKNAGFEVLHWESRSGTFEYANPLIELRRKRFLLDILAIPYSTIATLLGMGDSMSIIGRKK